MPKYWGAITNSFSYKNFSIYAMVTYKLGHIFREPIMFNPNMNAGAMYETGALRWKEKGDNTNYPAWKEYSEDREMIYVKSNALLHDASHVRLNDVVLKYRLSKTTLQKNKCRKHDYQLSN